MIFSNRVTDITQDKFIPVIVDQTLNSNVFMARVFAGGTKRWQGETLVQPIQVSQPTTGGSFSGMDTFAAALSNNTQKFRFEPKAYYQSVVISGIEEAVNSTSEAQVLSLVSTSLEIAQNAMTDSIGNLLYLTGAGDNFDGLGVIVDDATDTSTYGQLTRATYPVINATRTAATGGVLDLDFLAALVRSAAAAGGGKTYPTLGLTTEAIWDLYESLLTPTVNANYAALDYKYVTANTRDGQTVKEDALRGTQGFRSLTYRGIPLVADEKCTSGNLFLLNENYLDWYNLKSSKLKAVPTMGDNVDTVDQPKAAPIQWKEFQMPTAQFAEIGQFMLMGNLVTAQPRRHAKGVSITTV